ncbi:ubiquitin carboxyl-terminal hydrolase MINDY-3 [Petromyzon marinus]|uniref:Ubiquitin carboxyl-terminal hydrolase MINDY n=2 Tax=Petromyzon marinus TaxID=7757 RepID=A0AAJ7TDH9_PETMA|nr:ubiquitin carboxyl-terminal hydrolase MINDY-3 [Petromyzon marinus]
MADLREVADLLWGSGGSRVADAVFRRWTQGFVFSEDEPTALEQFEGGPCAVIVPVQAFLLKNALFGSENINWKECSEDERRLLLCHGLCEILEKAQPPHASSLCLVRWAKGKEQLPGEDDEQDQGAPNSAPSTRGPSSAAHTDDPSSDEITFERFHNLIHRECVANPSELRAAVTELVPDLMGNFGVLLFLYSLILTKGIENIKNETEDPNIPLIDPTYGHGSQSLINLLLTGQAVSNVWDGEKECSGMRLFGMREQATIGFLTLMESFRLCQVGSFLKSPQVPIWVLGSETHLTIFFTKELSVVASESPTEHARRVFKSFDPEDNGFILDSMLEDLMKTLDLFADPEYVNIMKTKLDPEGLGLILLGPFILEFFPEQEVNIPESFTVYHYNGLRHSCPKEKVSYTEGTAMVMGFHEAGLSTDDTPVKSCLQTKWPYLELLWSTARAPSLN